MVRTNTYELCLRLQLGFSTMLPRLVGTQLKSRHRHHLLLSLGVRCFRPTCLSRGIVTKSLMFIVTTDNLSLVTWVYQLFFTIDYHHHQLASITQQETIFWDDRLPPPRRKSYHEHRITPEKSQKLSHHKSMNFAMVVKSHSICRHFKPTFPIVPSFQILAGWPNLCLSPKTVPRAGSFSTKHSKRRGWRG